MSMVQAIDLEGGALMRRACDPVWHFIELAFRCSMAVELRRSCPTLDGALSMATDTLNEFLSSEGIGFGHTDYAWDHAAAVTIAREWQTQYWEAA